MEHLAVLQRQTDAPLSRLQHTGCALAKAFAELETNRRVIARWVLALAAFPAGCLVHRAETLGLPRYNWTCCQTCGNAEIQDVEHTDKVS